MTEQEDKEYAAAYAIVEKQVKETRHIGENGIEGVTWDDAARCIVMSKHLLFYTQLSGWIEKGIIPYATAENNSSLLDAAKSIKSIVDLGYVDGYGWWPMANLKWSKTEMIKNTLLMMALGFHIEAIQKRTMYLVAASFWIVLDVILGHGWQKRGRKFMKEAVK